MTVFSWHAACKRKRSRSDHCPEVARGVPCCSAFFKFFSRPKRQRGIARSEKGLMVKVFHIWSLVPQYE